MTSPFRGRGARAAITLGLLAAAAFARAAQDDDEEPPHDGRWLYERNCSGCHNDNGDGKGPTITALGLQARDFKAGGFAFGDSREQMFRTVSTGIPGRSPMPSFAGVLDEEERWMVVDYVRTLMPPRKDEAPANTEMIVSDRAVIARGKLPPIGEGARDTVRGLLIGTREGMTFEYDIDGVKLLGVRFGRFASREDWSERGGGYLRPLGQVVWTPQNAEGLSFHARMGARVSPEGEARRVLTSTWLRDGAVGLSYDVRDAGGAGRRLAAIDESLSVRTTSLGPAFVRARRFLLGGDMETVSLELASLRDESDPNGALLLTRETDAGVEVTHLRADTRLRLRPADVAPTVIDLASQRGRAFTLTTATLRVPSFTPEIAAQLREEFDR